MGSDHVTSRTPTDPGPLPSRRRAGLLIVALAAITGATIARVLDWRSHAHPR